MKRILAIVPLLAALALATPSTGELVQHGNFRVKLDASLTPKRLPRNRAAPVRFSTSLRFTGTEGHSPPQLRKISIEINRHGQINPGTVPLCRMDEIQPATTAAAQRACAASLVGEGRLSSKVEFTQQAPFPSRGQILAFNGRWKGRPAILAHVYGDKPVPTSFTIPFVISKHGRGDFGTQLAASIPEFSGKWGYVSAISLSLDGGRRHSSYLTASCPAPEGLNIVGFPLSRTELRLTDSRGIRETITRTCSPR